MLLRDEWRELFDSKILSQVYLPVLQIARIEVKLRFNKDIQLRVFLETLCMQNSWMHEALH